MRKYEIKKIKKKKINKKKLYIVAAFFCVVLSYSLYAIIVNLGKLNAGEVIMTPAEPPFTKEEVSLDKLINTAKKNNVSIYLPTELPNNYELSAIYLREDNFIAILVYSAEEIKDFKTAELVIEIKPTSDTPTTEELESQGLNEHEQVLEINGWPVYINSKAFGDSSERTREKYGLYTILADIWIGNSLHSINAPALETDDVIKIINKMALKE
ncbi:MAG: hypothetical protein BAJALOKI2v1_210044 [Promethearchaeota archaeon]|nr:MAG: hypothetical protein BAJALOKI2v1_210044 [Candidatus Lokiarchaeota archaeon]